MVYGEGNMPNLARAIALRLFRRIIHIYFRELTVVCQPEKTTHSRLFAANHVNALVDPILVLTTAPCVISPLAKSTLWKIPGLRYLLDLAQAVPVFRRRDNPNKDANANDAMFEKVSGHLAAGGNVLIFPEGTSHSEPQVLPLRTGAARMLTMAHESGSPDVNFQTVALEFDARELFRSRVLVLYGPVRYLRDLIGKDTEETVTNVNQTMSVDLKELIVEGQTWEERLLIARVSEMLLPELGNEQESELVRLNQLGRRVEAARQIMRGTAHDERIAELAQQVEAYYQQLARAGVTDAQVAGTIQVPPQAWLRAVWLLMLVPLAVVGVVLYWIPYQIPRLAYTLTKEKDVISTYKLGLGLLVYPLWAIALLVVSWFVVPAPWVWGSGLLAILSPFAALAWVDRLENPSSTLRAFLTGGRVNELIKESRGQVMNTIQEIRGQLEAQGIET
jgi:glycerol-3-phosphate O-acyltransferase / dihydroxyacetone phosphate acyltransferase